MALRDAEAQAEALEALTAHAPGPDSRAESGESADA